MRDVIEFHGHNVKTKMVCTRCAAYPICLYEKVVVNGNKTGMHLSIECSFLW